MLCDDIMVVIDADELDREGEGEGGKLRIEYGGWRMRCESCDVATTSWL